MLDSPKEPPSLESRYSTRDDRVILAHLIYLEQSRKYMAAAAEVFDKGELGEASGHGWGAAATIVKAVAEERGWPHDNVRDLFRVVNRLADELRAPEARLQFQLASSLHTNFYESWLERPYVRDSLAQVALFIARLEALLTYR